MTYTPRLAATLTVLFFLFGNPLVCTRAADATDPSTKSFDVPAGDASITIKQFAKQADRAIMYPSEPLTGVQTSAIKGNFTPHEALDRMLAGTDFVAIEDVKSGALAVKRVNGPNAQRAALANNSVRPNTQADESMTDEDAHMMGVYEVKDKKPFTDANVDIVRTMNDAQPYYIFKGETIQQSGAANVEDFIRQRLTMDTQANSVTQAGGAVFPATASLISLRGLGSKQTLILINGRRAAENRAFNVNMQPDLNALPLAAIERIEVLPSSAAAIYGGNAVGGVINIVLKNNYSGGDLKMTYENTVDTDAPIRTLDLSYGLTLEGGKTHLLFSAHYSDGKALLAQDRMNLVARGLNTILGNNPTFIYSTSTNPFRGALPNIASTNGSNLTLRDGTPLNSPITYIPAGISASTPAATLNSALLANAGHYNTTLPDNYGSTTGLRSSMGAVPRTKTIFVSFRREMTANLELFSDFANSSDIKAIMFRPNPTVFRVPASAPDNPFAQAVTVAAPDSLGDRLDADNVNRRVTTGLVASLPWDWKTEVDYTWNVNEYKFSQYFGPTYAAQINTDLASGKLNPFVDTSLNPLNLNPYVGVNSDKFPSSLNSIGAHASGPVWHLPGGIPNLTIGLERRMSGLKDALLVNRFASFPSSTTQMVQLGALSTVESIYGELQIPVVSPENQVVGVHLLDLQIAARGDRFTTPIVSPNPINLASPPSSLSTVNTSVKSSNPTIGIRYKPIGDLMLRASYGTAFLPPSVDQLIPSATAAATVLDPMFNNMSVSTIQQTGGNPNLKPEKSTSWNAGLVLEPAAVKGLRLAVDWYQIKKRDQIGSLTTQQTVDFAYQGLLPSDLITRDPTTKQITLIDVRSRNFTKLSTEGFDITFEYRRPTSSLGTFDIFALATYIRRFKQQVSFNTPFADIVNWVDVDGGPLQHKANATLTWELSRLTIGWTTVFFGRYPMAGAAGDPVTSTQANVLAQGSDHVPSQIYHNIYASYTFGVRPGADENRHLSRESGFFEGLTLQGGVKNVFNAAPPLDVTAGTYGYYSTFGDPRLMSYYLSVRQSF